jgi:2-oxoglutarate dehydrogenase E2 component (dihydrolipoamide succinyltransferase)
MIIDITVPDLGESINEVEIGEWLVKIDDSVETDDPLVAIESEKASVEVPAPQGGVLVEIIKQQGEAAEIGELIGRIDTEQADSKKEDTSDQPSSKAEEKTGDSEEKVMPSAARVMAQKQISPEQVTPTGPGGRILKEDAMRAAAKETARESAKKVEPAEKTSTPREERRTQPMTANGAEESEEERRVPMSLLRRTLAARLLEATQSMAMLTTFNEVDMSKVKRLRTTLGSEFADKHGIRLGFMSFFVKAAVAGLRDFPLVNARIDGEDVVYRSNCHIGVAIGGGKGLIVPVIRKAERLNFAEIEQQIADFGERAKKNSLSPAELHGGTFTISNGGVYGSMLSTPIVNPPQSAILGLHTIKDRPVAVDGEVVIRPVMYLALSYDHRIIDGREAVSFLKSIKERIEQPQKLLLEI